MQLLDYVKFGRVGEEGEGKGFIFLSGQSWQRGGVLVIGAPFFFSWEV